MAWWNWPTPRPPSCRRFAELKFKTQDGQMITLDEIITRVVVLETIAEFLPHPGWQPTEDDLKGLGEF